MRAARSRRRQGGAALLLALIVAATVAAGLLLGGNALAGKRIGRDLRSAQALAAAKEALIGYAVAKSNPPGRLPCPDPYNAGTAPGSCAITSVIGRLPWKTIGLGDLRDGDGECLWYAVSPAFKPGAAVVNSNTAGTLTIKNDSGAVIASQVVAVIFAPGGAVAGQDRSATTSTVCSGNTAAAAAAATNYLDTGASGVNNASGNRSGSYFTFVVAERGAAFNDQIAYITATDLFTVLNARVAAEISGDATHGLRGYFSAHADALPWAAGTAGGTQQTDLTSGYIPYGDPDSEKRIEYAGSGWLNDNGWFAIAGYRRVQANQAQITLGGTSYAYTFE